MRVPLLLLLLCAPTAASARAQEDFPSLEEPQPAVSTTVVERPDAQPPIGVGTTPLLERDQISVSYHLERTELDGLREGTGNVSTTEVLAEGFTRAPVDGVIATHYLRAEFGLADNLTLSTELPFHNVEWTQEGGPDLELQRLHGLGDVRVGGRLAARRDPDRELLLGLELSLPTGSIRSTVQQDGAPRTVPYALRLGSGTLDLVPQLAYLHQWRRWSFGVQAEAALRTGQNSRGYTLGDRLDAHAWFARRLHRDHSVSLRFSAAHWENIDGADPTLDPAVNPLEDPTRQGGTRVSAFVGLNYVGVGGHRFGLELGGPLLQNLDGPQFDVDFVGWLSWRFAP